MSTAKGETREHRERASCVLDSGTAARGRRGPIFMVLVLLAVGMVAVASAAVSPVQVPSNRNSGLSTARGPPGVYVSLICLHGTISVNGTQRCSNTTTPYRDLCPLPYCYYRMVGTVDSGYSFTGWVLTGQASVACRSCLSTTLTLRAPIPVYQYSATVNETVS